MIRLAFVRHILDTLFVRAAFLSRLVVILPITGMWSDSPLQMPSPSVDEVVPCILVIKRSGVLLPRLPLDAYVGPTAEKMV